MDIYRITFHQHPNTTSAVERDSPSRFITAIFVEGTGEAEFTTIDLKRMTLKNDVACLSVSLFFENTGRVSFGPYEWSVVLKKHCQILCDSVVWTWGLV